MKFIRNETINRILLVLSSFLFSLVFAAVVFQIYDYYVNDRYFVWKPNLVKRIMLTPGTMPGVYGSSVFSINSQGIRGDEFNEKFNGHILAVGGSTTECLYLDDTEAWPKVLQERLNDGRTDKIWVGNIGMSGRNILNHTLQIEYMLQQYPFIDTVLLLVGINDLERRLALDNDYIAQDVGNPEDREKVMNRAFEIYPKSIDHFSDLKIYKVVKSAIDLSYGMSRQTAASGYQDIAGVGYIEWRAMRQAAESYIDELPDMTSAKDEFSLHLHKILDITKEHNVRLILLTQPSMYKEDISKFENDLLWFGFIKRRGSRQYYSVKSMMDGLEVYNRLTRDFCTSNGVECVDLANIIPRSTRAFYDDVHFNESGARLVADAVYEYLISNPSPEAYSPRGSSKD